MKILLNRFKISEFNLSKCRQSAKKEIREPSDYDPGISRHIKRKEMKIVFIFDSSKCKYVLLSVCFIFSTFETECFQFGPNIKNMLT